MNQDQKDAVRESWALVKPIADQAAILFYDRLFEIDPATRLLFRAEAMPEQRRKLMQTLDTLVTGLDWIDDLVPAIEDLGRRHLRYGVQEAQYESVGAALLWTLEQGLGERWTDETRDAWTAVYALTAEAMKRAARNAPSVA